MTCFSPQKQSAAFFLRLNFGMLIRNLRDFKVLLVLGQDSNRKCSSYVLSCVTFALFFGMASFAVPKTTFFPICFLSCRKVPLSICWCLLGLQTPLHLPFVTWIGFHAGENSMHSVSKLVGKVSCVIDKVEFITPLKVELKSCWLANLKVYPFCVSSSLWKVRVKMKKTAQKSLPNSTINGWEVDVITGNNFDICTMANFEWGGHRLATFDTLSLLFLGDIFQWRSSTKTPGTQSRWDFDQFWSLESEQQCKGRRRRTISKGVNWETFIAPRPEIERCISWRFQINNNKLGKIRFKRGRCNDTS